ncbi:MAG: glycosyltransferase [Actinobacteria bacterium]|nr:glycosyltransferase [Actinomycetota bacterium]
MRILIAHAFHRLPGGENRYVERQMELLGKQHDVQLLERSNTHLPQKARTAAAMAYSRAAVGEVVDAISSFGPDIVHLHNPYPAFGPAVHLACRRTKTPLIQTIHNFRLRCPNGLMFTEGKNCTRCLGGNYAHSLMHGCFPTRTQAAGYAGALWMHRVGLRLERHVDAFIAPSRFMRERLLSWGIGAGRIATIPNFINEEPRATSAAGSYGLYLGRLVPEKGVDVLIDALRGADDPPFVIAGTGPEHGALVDRAARLGLRGVRFAGMVPEQDARSLVEDARYVVVPSLWDENAPLSALEAMALGRPLIAASNGGLRELVATGAGLAFPTGDATLLAVAIRHLQNDTSRCEELGTAGLRAVTDTYGASAHRRELEALYGALTASRRRGDAPLLRTI